jgi:murein DD-endopeptidase
MRPVRLLIIALSLMLGACATSTASVKEIPAAPAARAAGHAQKMVGKPYKFGGATPARGFDCSGLVQYSYSQAGVTLPHSTDKQRAVSRLVKRAEMRPGDLIFFNQEGKKHGHVGIYLGDGKFVHAPSSGKSVRTDRLDSPYWSKHLTEIRRPA